MNFLRENKKYVVVFSIFAIIIVIALIGTNIYNNQQPVVTEKNNDNSKLPNINIESKNMDALNKELDRLYRKYTSDGKSKFNYETYYYNDVISILVSIDEYIEKNKVYQKKFLGYNIDRKGNYLTEEEIASMFGTDIKTVKQKVLDRLSFYHTEEDRLGYLEKEECDFSCYLSFVRNINDIMDHIALVIENSKLVAYVGFDKDSFYEDSAYFDNLNYNIYKVIIK